MMDFLDLFVARECVPDMYLVNGTVPRTGEIELFIPICRDEGFHHVDAHYLHALNDTLKSQGYHDFGYIGHGEHAFVASAKDRDGLTHILRMTLGGLKERDCANVFEANHAFTLDDKISCERMEFLEIIHVPSPKLTLGLAVSCLADGWDFWDHHGRNIAQRLGDAAIGVLEPQAVTYMMNDRLDPAARVEDYFSHIDRNMRNRMQELNKDRDMHNAYARIHQEQGIKGSFYCQGDVVETRRHLVMNLNGDHYASRIFGQNTQHPSKGERRDAVLQMADILGITAEARIPDFVLFPRSATETFRNLSSQMRLVLSHVDKAGALSLENMRGFAELASRSKLDAARE